MKSLKYIFRYAIFVVLFFGFSLSASATTLGISGDKFTVDGQPKFLVFASYFDGIHSSNLSGDLDYLKSKGINSIRVMPNWPSGWNGSNFSTDILMDSSGNLRSGSLDSLKNLINTANSKGMIVDISFTRETVAGSFPITNYKKGIESAVNSLKDNKNVFYDFQNEANCNSFITQDASELRQRIKAISSNIIVSTSLACEISPVEAVNFAVSTGMDIVNYHESRGGNWWDLTQTFAQELKSAGKPSYFGEPGKLADKGTYENFMTAVDGAKKGGAAAWTFHTRAGFDLDGHSFQSRLISQETSFLDNFNGSLQNISWGGGIGSTTGGGTGSGTGGSTGSGGSGGGSDSSDGGNVTAPKPPSEGSSLSITNAPLTNTWRPTQTSNGWFPKLSPDGKYVLYGFGQTWVTDIATKTEKNLTVSGTKCFSLGWLTSTKLTFSCEVTGHGELSDRYEASPPDWSVIKTADSPSLVSGNILAAADGHWASWGYGRITKDNKVLVSDKPGGALAISKNQLVHACDNENKYICLWGGNSKIATYTSEIPLHEMSLTDGYIVYGGLGPIHGIDPNGDDIDLTLNSGQPEWQGRVVLALGKPWVASVKEGSQGEQIVLRPYSSEIVISTNAPAASLDVVFTDNKFLVAYSNDRGALEIGTLDVDPTLLNSIANTSETDTGPNYGLEFNGAQNIETPTRGLPTDIAQLIEAIFMWSLGIIGLVIFVRFFWAGFKWFTAAGSSSAITEAKEIMWNALYGAIVLFAAYLILNTINPDLVKSTFTLPGLPAAQTDDAQNNKSVAACDIAGKESKFQNSVSSARESVLLRDHSEIADQASTTDNISKFVGYMIESMKSKNLTAGLVKECGSETTQSGAFMVGNKTGAGADTYGEVCSLTAGVETKIKDLNFSCLEHRDWDRLIP